LRKTVLNPRPDPAQTAPNERVERIRRIQQNDLESLPYFLVSGFLFVASGPPLLLARVLLYGFVVTRLLHFAAYLGQRDHEIRATFWSLSSLILVFITGWSLVAALH
jgi:glutathione S-transferase